MRPSISPRPASHRSAATVRRLSIFAAAVVALVATSAADAPAVVAAPAPPPAATSSIGPIAKAHNLDLGNGMMGLELTIPTELIGVAGQTIAVAVWFYDAAGQPIASALEGWGAATGQLRVISSEAQPASARERVEFPVRVPYAAFPRRREGRYAVEARAVLVERVGNGRVVLARRSTTFFVE